jgi:hypothetical protein
MERSRRAPTLTAKQRDELDKIEEQRSDALARQQAAAQRREAAEELRRTREAQQVAAKSAADEVKRLKAEQREARELEALQRKVEKEIAKALEKEEKEEKAKATREANAAAQLAKEDAAIVRAVERAERDLERAEAAHAEAEEARLKRLPCSAREGSTSGPLQGLLLLCRAADLVLLSRPTWEPAYSLLRDDPPGEPLLDFAAAAADTLNGAWETAVGRCACWYMHVATSTSPPPLLHSTPSAIYFFLLRLKWRLVSRWRVLTLQLRTCWSVL